MEKSEKLYHELIKIKPISSLDISYITTYFVSEYDEMDFETLTKIAELTNIFDNIGIIDYGVAMDFLKKHDNTLNISMNLAIEKYASLESITSEYLATILNEHINRTKWHENYTEIDNAIKSIYQ